MDEKTIKSFDDAGVELSSRRMGNGETRYYMMNAGAEQGYILTVAGVPGEGVVAGWQNGHSHAGNREFYAVRHGFLAFADIHEGKYRVRLIGPDDDEVCSKPGVPHNVYLPPDGASIHTVKWGRAVGNPDNNNNDWYAAPKDFDVWCKSLSEDDIRQLAV